MAMDQPPPERPIDPQAEGGAAGPAGQFPSREELRELTGALAAGLPAESVPQEPVSPDVVRELAADLAAEIIQQLAQPSGASPDDDVQGFGFSMGGARLPYRCTGQGYTCGGTIGSSYICPTAGSHACTGMFSCSNTFSGLTATRLF